jgi:glutamate dehydrogenase/leucine dehydrogenase
MSDSLFASVQAQILKSYEYLKDQYDSHLIQKLLYPDRVITVYIPVKMDNGQTQVFVWYRSQHNSARGPYKWGIRYHPDVSQDEVMSLSAWMSIKCSVVGIPLGGGKWGIVLDPKTLSSRELEQVSRWYIRALYKLIGKDVDVPAPDVNTDGRIMAWMADEYSRLVWVWTPGVITGKPLMSGGSLGRDVATALGWVYVLETYYAYKGKSLTWSTVAIQWAGNADLTLPNLSPKSERLSQLYLIVVEQSLMIND